MKTLVNPIEQEISTAIVDAKSISIAVPFLASGIVNKLFKVEELAKIPDKRIIIKLDDSHLISYDLAAIKQLLNCGFKVCFDNTIHLKLYILGERVFISSGNLTEGGMNNNFELTVECSKEESGVTSIFDRLWDNNQLNEITPTYIEDNWHKYLFLKRKHPIVKPAQIKTSTVQLTPSTKKIIDAVFYEKIDRTGHLNRIAMVYKKRSAFIDKITINGFDQSFFYISQDNKATRKESLFYEFVYGDEEKLAGTGLRESQFKDVFTNENFEKVLFYIYPQFKDVEHKWNFLDNSEYQNFCEGLFEFRIPNFKEALPIRLANFFYPNYFLPIFKLDHLRDICQILGFTTDSTSRGQRLAEYNIFLNEKTKDIPYNNFVKSTMLYKLLHTIAVKNEIDRNDSIEIHQFIQKHRKEWVRNTMTSGLHLIENL